MINQLHDNASPEISLQDTMVFPSEMLNGTLGYHKGHKYKKNKHSKNKKSHNKKQAYAQLAFQYGILAARYDTLTKLVGLSIAAKRGRLNDDLLDDGLTALGGFRSLPEYGH